MGPGPPTRPRKLTASCGAAKLARSRNRGAPGQTTKPARFPLSKMSAALSVEAPRPQVLNVTPWEDAYWSAILVPDPNSSKPIVDAPAGGTATSRARTTRAAAPRLPRPCGHAGVIAARLASPGRARKPGGSERPTCAIAPDLFQSRTHAHKNAPRRRGGRGLVDGRGRDGARRASGQRQLPRVADDQRAGRVAPGAVRRHRRHHGGDHAAGPLGSQPRGAAVRRRPARADALPRRSGLRQD